MKRTASTTLTLCLAALAMVAFAAVLMGADGPTMGAPARVVTPRPPQQPYGPGGGIMPPRLAAPAAPPAPVSEAGVMLQVTYTRESLPGGASTLTYLARSHGVLETAVAETLKEPPACRLDVRIMEQRRQESISTAALCQLHLTLEAKDADAQARKALTAVIARLRSALAETAKQQQDVLRKRVAEADREAELARLEMNRLHSNRAELAKEAGMPDPDRGRILSRVRSLESKRESLAVDVAGLRVRVQATQEQVAKLTAKASAAAKDDPVAAELAKVVAFREEQVSRREQAQAGGRATKAEVMEAAAQLAEAKARLAERRQQAAAAAAGPLLTELNAQLVHDSIALVEKEAQLKAVSDQLKPLQDPALLRTADQYAATDYELRRATDRYRQASQRRADLQKELAATRAPTVIVIGG